jgi:hypothetical protein
MTDALLRIVPRRIIGAGVLALGSSVAAAAQGRPSGDALPTVGDTIWTVRTVLAPRGAEVRAPDWKSEGPVETLGHALVQRRGDTVVVAWPLVGWEPGTHRVDVPGPLLVRADGREDSLPAQTVSVTVASVLPAEAKRLQPQPAAGLVRRRTTAPLPLLLALGAAGLLVGGLVLWRRRKRPVPPLPAPPPVASLPLARWQQAGEESLLLELAVQRCAPRRDEPSVAAWLADVERARFGGAPSDRLRALRERAP